MNLTITIKTEKPVSPEHTRIGNILYQVSICLSIQYMFGYIAIFPDLKNDFDGIYSEYKNTIFRNLNFSYFDENNCCKYDELFKYRGIYQFRYLPLDTNTKNILLTGYFQSHFYIDSCKNELKKVLSPDDNSMKYITEKYKFYCDKNIVKICIHVRRGDYISHNINLSLDYYHKAIAIFENTFKNIQHNYIIFSDDIEWVKSQQLFMNSNTIIIDNEKDYIHLWMMNMCDHYILANSTFSWWGSYLSQNSDPIVYYSKTWFDLMRKTGKETKEEFLNKNKLREHDFIVDSWISI